MIVYRAHNIYAEIFEETVQNVIVCDDYSLANQIAKATYGDEAFAVDISQIPCKIGDKYRNGTFYRVKEDGTEVAIEPIPTLERQVQILSREHKAFNEHDVDLDFRLSMSELKVL